MTAETQQFDVVSKESRSMRVLVVDAFAPISLLSMLYSLSITPRYNKKVVRGARSH
jgi:hypothetical protein